MNKELVAHMVANVKRELGNRAGADKCAASSSAGMLQVEQLVHESLMELGRQVVQDLATETDTGYLGPRLKRGQVVFRFKRNRPKTVHGRYGPVTVLHACYASGSGEMWVPLDEPLGIEFGADSRRRVPSGPVRGPGAGSKEWSAAGARGYRQRWRHQW